MELNPRTACMICGKEKPGFATFGMVTPNGKAVIIPKANLRPKNLKAMQGVYEDLFICGECTRINGKTPETNWKIWMISTIVYIIAMILYMIVHSGIIMALAAVAFYFMWFSGMSLLMKSSAGSGLKFLFCFLALTPLAAIPILQRREEINTNSRIITALQKYMAERKEKPKDVGKPQANLAREAADIVEKYRRALVYLNQCDSFDEEKLREVNRLSGNRFSEEDIRQFLQMAEIAPSGMNAIRDTLRDNLKEGIRVLDNMKEQDADRTLKDIL